MKKIIFVIIAIFMINVVGAYAENLVYSTELSYNDGAITKKNIAIIETTQEIKEIVGGEYDAKLYSFDNKLLFQTSFNFELERTDEANPEWFDQEGNQIKINMEESKAKQEITKTIFLPYFKEGREIKIYRYDKLKLTVDVSDLASCNNNGKCDNGETSAVCPKECLCGNKVCNKGETYSTCSSDCQKENKKSSFGFWERMLNFIKSLFT